jgi:hypothetical protein
MTDGVDDIINPFLGFWCGNNCFFIVCTCGLDLRGRWDIAWGLRVGRGGVQVVHVKVQQDLVLDMSKPGSISPD